LEEQTEMANHSQQQCDRLRNVLPAIPFFITPKHSSQFSCIHLQISKQLSPSACHYCHYLPFRVFNSLFKRLYHCHTAYRDCSSIIIKGL